MTTKSAATPVTLTPALLDFWLKNGMNVLFEGERGVGKTAMIKDCFDRNGLKWKYFSAATMDPWVDFVGIPRAVKREDGKDVLDFVMNADFADDQIEAIVFDEFNRSKSKTRDAVMELIQFKSINGRKFNRLKVVWAAINPPKEDDNSTSYQVDVLDPALVDRFHVYVKVPFRPDRTFFKREYGAMGINAVSWWHEQEKNIQAKIPPRRLEYAVQMFRAGGSTKHVFDPAVPSQAFETALKVGTVTDLVSSFMTKKDVKGAKDWLKQSNNEDVVTSLLKKNSSLRPFFLPLLNMEKVVQIMAKSQKILSWVVENEKTNDRFQKILDSIVTSKENKKLAKSILKARPLSAEASLTLLMSSKVRLETSNNTYSRIQIMEEGLETYSKMDKKTAKARVALVTAMTVFINRTQRYTMSSHSRVRKLIKRYRADIGWSPAQIRLMQKKGFSSTHTYLK